MKNRHPHHHIKKHLAKGRTFDFIRKELKLLGHEEKHIERLIKSYLINHHLAKPIAVSIIPLILLLSLLSIEPTITGNVILQASCIPKWECTNWDPPKCPPTGIQTRICTELGVCGTSKPKEMRRCVNISEVKDFIKDLDTKISAISSPKPTNLSTTKNHEQQAILAEAKKTTQTSALKSQELYSPNLYIRFQLILVIIVLALIFFIYYPHRVNYIIGIVGKEVIQLDKSSKEISEKAIKKTKKLYSKIYAKYLNLIKLPSAQPKIMGIYNKINKSHSKLAKQIKLYNSTLNKLNYCSNLIDQIKGNMNNADQAAELYCKLCDAYVELTKQNIGKRKIKKLYKEVLQIYKTLTNM